MLNTKPVRLKIPAQKPAVASDRTSENVAASNPPIPVTKSSIGVLPPPLFGTSGPFETMSRARLFSVH